MDFDSDPGRNALPRAVQWLFRPIARMLVRNGILGRDMLEVMKRAYVEATMDVLQERGLPVTLARLKIFTGFPGKDIESIQRALNHPADEELSRYDQFTHLMTAWHLDQRYALQFVDGPRELPISGGPTDATFTSLCREFAPGLDPDDVLAELMSIEAVTVDTDKRTVRLIKRAYLPKPYSAANTERLGRAMRNLSQTLEFNFQASDPKGRRFDRHVSADFPISSEDETEFEAKARELSQRLLEDLDGWLQGRERPSENGRRVGLNIFSYIEDDGSTSEKDPSPEEYGRQEPEGSAEKEVLGPYYMGTDERKIMEGPTNGAKRDQGDDADDDVIDTLNYRGPKK